MAKVLYFHGLGGEASPEVNEMFERLGIDPIQMSHDYELEWAFDKMHSFIRKQVFIANVFEPTFVVGNSYGGYIAYNLAKMLDLPCMLINPALDRNLTKTPLKHINFPQGRGKDNFTEVFLGKQDDLVPGVITKNFLQRDHDNYNIIEYPGGHNVNLRFWRRMLNDSKIIGDLT